MGGLSRTNGLPLLLALALVPCACSGDVTEEHVLGEAGSNDAGDEPDVSPDATTDHLDAFETDVTDAADADTGDESCTEDPNNPYPDTLVVTCCAGKVCQGECVAGECMCGLVSGGCAPYLCCYTKVDDEVECEPENVCIAHK